MEINLSLDLWSFKIFSSINFPQPNHSFTSLSPTSLHSTSLDWDVMWPTAWSFRLDNLAVTAVTWIVNQTKLFSFKLLLSGYFIKVRGKENKAKMAAWICKFWNYQTSFFNTWVSRGNHILIKLFVEKCLCVISILFPLSSKNSILENQNIFIILVVPTSSH